MKEYCVRAAYDAWDAVSAKILLQLKLDSINIKAIRKIMMALEEVVSNIIKYNKDDASITIDYCVVNNSVDEEIVSNKGFVPQDNQLKYPCVVVVVRDNGIPFNPIDRSAMNGQCDFDNRIGGMGIIMIRNLMDITDYKYCNENVLIMVKNLE